MTIKLDDICFQALTLRELLRKSFRDDWNSRRAVFESSPGMIYSVHLTLSQEGIPMELARQVLEEVMAEEALKRKDL
jgi:hypothetical protein